MKRLKRLAKRLAKSGQLARFDKVVNEIVLRRMPPEEADNLPSEDKWRWIQVNWKPHSKWMDSYNLVHEVSLAEMATGEWETLKRIGRGDKSTRQLQKAIIRWKSRVAKREKRRKGGKK